MLLDLLTIEINYICILELNETFNAEIFKFLEYILKETKIIIVSHKIMNWAKATDDDAVVI